MYPQKNLSTSMKILVVFAVSVFGFTLINATISTTAQSSQTKRQLDARVPAHLPIKIKIKKEKEEAFQDLNNEHWARDFELEVKNTGDRPIYALTLLWMLRDVRGPDVKTAIFKDQLDTVNTRVGTPLLQGYYP